MTDVKLTKKQEKFVDIYTETGNATEAAMQAYDCTDRKSAGVIGAQNLNKVSVAEAVRNKSMELRDCVIDKLNDTKAIDLAIQSALHDLKTDSAMTYQARKAAREFIAKLLQLVQSQEQTKNTTNNKQVNNYLYPKK